MIKLREVALPEGMAGRLYLHSMPGRYETLQEFIEAAVAHEIDEVVCLVSENDIAENSPDYLTSIFEETFQIPRTEFPISDLGIPHLIAPYFAFVRQLAMKILDGKHLLLHCAAGIGRTGMTAQCVLIALDLDPIMAKRLVRAAGSTPETHAQHDLIEQFIQETAS